jgi:dTMP kinase
MVISLEGPDGVGKTTLTAALLPHLPQPAISLRCPGSTPLAEAIRKLVLDPDLKATSIELALLFNAADLSTLEYARGLPFVLLDRCFLSDLAYRGAEDSAMGALSAQLTLLVGNRLPPENVFYLRRPVDEIVARKALAKGDRFEGRGEAFLRKVHAQYELLAQRGLCVVVDLPSWDVDECVRALLGKIT